MCTVVCHWSPGSTVRLLALRDELAGRAFDLPGAWWAGQPQVIGGRDRLGGGTWCASDVRAGVTAVVLNRPELRRAVAGAPSRGVLPLLAVQWLADWPSKIELAGMASFNLVLVTPEALTWWCYDGESLQQNTLGAGTHMFTPRGLAVPIDARFADTPPAGADPDGGDGRADPDCAGSTGQLWAGWLPVVRQSVPSSDPQQLLVRISVGADSFETVFGQFICGRPGALRLDYLVTPDRGGSWTIARWRERDGQAVADG
jgi:hypothetical protein